MGRVVEIAITVAVATGWSCGSSDRPAPIVEDADLSGLCEEDRERHAGDATYYDADGSGNCGFEASPGDLLVAAINTADYAGAVACGACIAVDGPAGSVTVRVVDRCPGCAAGDLDLSTAAFDAIADRDAGRVSVAWRFVTCEVAGPLRYRFKEGSSEFWTAIQVRNHRHAIATFEVRGDDGTYQAVARELYNYFVDASGMGPGPYDFRITDTRGQVVEETGVALADAEEVAGAAQLPACAP